MISIILPSYNEKENLVKLYKRLSTVTQQIPGHKFEFIFVDDCSIDDTLVTLREIADYDDRLQIIRFARNYGSHAAVTAGLKYCRGSAAIVLAADLQDPPEIIPKLLQQWQKGFKVVWGVRKKREGESFFTRFSSRLFYFLMNHLTDVSQPPSGADVFLIDVSVIRVFNESSEKNTSIFMLIAWLGFSQTYVCYEKEARNAGISKWTTSKRVKLLLDSLISFSYVPLRFMSFMGILFALSGGLYAIIVFINALRGVPVEGWSSLMVVVLFLGGFQMTMMGMLGEYIWRTYDESRSRPRYTIEQNTLIEDDTAQND